MDNYGKKFLYIMMSAAGMFIAIIGISYRTGYFAGHEGIESILMIAAGIFVTIVGLKRLRQYK